MVVSISYTRLFKWIEAQGIIDGKLVIPQRKTYKIMGVYWYVRIVFKIDFYSILFTELPFAPDKTTLIIHNYYRCTVYSTFATNFVNRISKCRQHTHAKILIPITAIQFLHARSYNENYWTIPGLVMMYIKSLTYWDCHKMADSSQTTFSNAFS